MKISGQSAGNAAKHPIIRIAEQPFTRIGWQGFGRQDDPEYNIEQEACAPAKSYEYKNQSYNRRVKAKVISQAGTYTTKDLVIFSTVQATSFFTADAIGGLLLRS